jgi:hypothetical protein
MNRSKNVVQSASHIIGCKNILETKSGYVIASEGFLNKLCDGWIPHQVGYATFAGCPKDGRTLLQVYADEYSKYLF